MSNKGDLTKGPIVSTLIRFTVPFLISNLLQTLYGTVDTLTVGNFGSTAGVSAVATGAQALSLVTFLAIGVSSGSTVLLGQRIGAKDYQEAARIIGNTIIDFGVISLLMTALMLAGYPVILNLLNLPSEALQEAHNYMVICAFGIPMIIGYNIVCALLRSIGDSKSPLLFVGIACLVNVAGDLILTGWLHMGAAGVAIATVLAQTVSFLYSLVFIMKKGMGFSFTKKNIRFNRSTTAAIFKIGLPMGLQSILVNLSFMFITSIINSMGLSASAAMGIGDKITGFAFMPQGAFSAAASVIVAQNVGAKQTDRALETVRISVYMCLAVEVVFLVVSQVWPNFLPGLFTNDEEVMVMAGQYMRAYSLDAILTSITFCWSGLLNGAGKTTFNMAQNLISTFLGRIPATYFLSKLPATNLFFIGLAAPLSTILSLVMLGWFIVTKRWQKGIFIEEM